MELKYQKRKYKRKQNKLLVIFSHVKYGLFTIINEQGKNYVLYLRLIGTITIINLKQY